MTEEKITELVIRVTSELATLNTNMRNVLDRLTNHEQRLMSLEERKEDSWKNQLLMLLAKAAVIGGVCIASLVGAGSLLSKIIGG